MQLRLGSLFSGFGGLDLAIERVFDARTLWVSDIEPGPCKVLARRFPGVPNLGDITKIDWSAVEPVDIIAGGSPCQDISSAGRMAGMREGTRSNLWVEMREAIRILRPAIVTWENVSAARSTAASSAMESDPRLLGDHPAGVPALRALGRVLGDLASLGYDAQWYSLRASEIGAPHGRLRYFILAADARSEARFEWSRLCETQSGGVWRGRPDNDDRTNGPLTYLPTPNTQDASNVGGPAQLNRNTPLNAVATLLPTPMVGSSSPAAHGQISGQWRDAMADALARTTLLPTPRASDGTKGGPNQRGSSGDLMLPSAVPLLPTPTRSDGTGGGVRTGLSWENAHKATGDGGASRLRDVSGLLHETWGPYAAAIARWEAIHGPAPSPTRLGKKGRPKLNPAFAEWMMGAAPGWITDVPGVTDNEALRMAGNGVVQQQAELALRIMADRFAHWSTP